MTTTVNTTAGTAAAHGRAAAWLVLLGMGGTSLTYNISHAIGGHLSVGLAVLYGLAPVGAAMGLSHIVAACRGGWVMRTITVIVMLGAMGLSVGATAAVVAPVAPGVLRYVFPAVMDAAALVALQVIMAPRQGNEMAPATNPGLPATKPPATNSVPAVVGGGATTDPAGPVRAAVTLPAGEDGDDAGDASKTPGKRGEIRRIMRAHWDTEVAAGRIPNGAELNRSASKEPDYSLGKRYVSEWRNELPSEMVGEWRRETPGEALAAGGSR